MKGKPEQVSLFCLDCKLRECDQQSLHCVFRLMTAPNWLQKRKIADEKRMLRKRQMRIAEIRKKALKQIADLEKAQEYSRTYLAMAGK
jgi:hypothetical protein